jgi:molybdenum cofactor biosynthesis protein B
MSVKQHKKDAPKSVDVGIVSISTSRTLAEDKSGHWIAGEAKREGHRVVHHQVVPDDRAAITHAVLSVIGEKSPHALLLTGGTGISPLDVTIESVSPMFEKQLSAFSPLFAQLSYEEIGSASLLSRSAAGVVRNTLVFCMPGSLAACKLACRELIFPELGHLVRHMRE